MNLVSVRMQRFSFPLRGPIRGGQQATRERSGLRIEIENDAGQVGLGEALPLPTFAGEDEPACLGAIEALARALLESEYSTLATVLDGLERLAPDTPVARSAFDIALHDLEAQALGVSVARLLCAEARSQIPLSALVVAQEPTAAADEAALRVQQGFSHLKFKVGSDAPEVDLKRLREVRKRIGAEPRLRLDANGAWDRDTAQTCLEIFACLDIEMLEQPVCADALEAMQWLTAHSPIPIFADEACVPWQRGLQYIEQTACRGIVLKPPVLGGLRPAWKLATAACEQNLPVVVTGFLDSPIGVAAALHLAAAIPGPSSLPAGLLAEAWFPQPISVLPKVTGATQPCPSGPGLGLRASALEGLVQYHGPVQSWRRP